MSMRTILSEALVAKHGVIGSEMTIDAYQRIMSKKRRSERDRLKSLQMQVRSELARMQRNTKGSVTLLIFTDEVLRSIQIEEPVLVS